MPKAFLIRKNMSARELYSLSSQWRPVTPPPSPDEDEAAKDQPLNLTVSSHHSNHVNQDHHVQQQHQPIVPQRIPVIKTTGVPVVCPSQSTSISHIMSSRSSCSSSDIVESPPSLPSPGSPPSPPSPLADSTTSNSSSYDLQGLPPPPTMPILAQRLGKVQQ